MSFNLEDFRGVLTAVLEDPTRANLLVDSIAQIGLDGSVDLQRAAAEELERAVISASAQTPATPSGRNFDGQPRIDMVMISPGGVVLKGRFQGKAYLTDILGCVVDEGRPLDCLTRAPFAEPFATVRDGQQAAQWFSFDGGQAGFAAVHPDPSDPANGRPDSIIGIFFTIDSPAEKRRDAHPNITPLALAKLLRAMNPAVAKTPAQWLMAVPDRRFLTLKDGRTLAIRQYGSPASRPILVFWPFHRSTMADPFIANAAIAHGRSVIVIERPGLGSSDSAPISCYRAVANDVAEIVLAMGLRSVSILGAGMAASFALATANRLGAIVDSVALLGPRIGRPSSMAPSAWGRVIWALLKNPYGIDVAARLFRQLRVAGSAQSLIMSLSVSNERDKRLLNDANILSYMVAQSNDAVHLGVRGAVAEFRLFQSGAFFDPSLVTQPIRVWQGEENTSLLKEDTLRAMSGAPHASFKFIPGGGILIDYEEAYDMVSWLSHGQRDLATGSEEKPLNGRLHYGL